MLGIVPAAGSATRMQPLGGSKELLPLGRHPPEGERHGAIRVISEFVLERMLIAGADRICLVVASDKSDLLRYFGRCPLAAQLFFTLQPQPAGLCDAVFRAIPLVKEDEPVLIGLPDTIWFPCRAYAAARGDHIHLITFPVSRPEEFDAVIESRPGVVAHVEVKQPGSSERRVWGAITMPGKDFLRLQAFWSSRGAREQYLGDLFNTWIGTGEVITCDRQGTHYFDIGTPAGYDYALRRRVWELENETDAASV
ncbi:MAG: nucleotidyltransferase family protein [Terriglobales bacterium]